MNFLRPAAFALAAVIPIVIAMYFLKPRRPDHFVSSLYLWERIVRDESATALWQRLRRNLLLLLQILLLVMLILALARPYLPTGATSGDSLILVIDTSTSMAATDVQPSRLDVARAKARDLIASLPDGGRITVIAAGEAAEVVVAQATDRPQAQRAVADLSIAYGDSELATALNLAGAIAARENQAEIVVLSDGGVNLPTTELPARVRYVPVGEDGNNQAIAAVDIRELAGGEAVSLFTRVANYDRATASRRLDIYVDGQLFDARRLTIPAGENTTVVRDDLPAGTEQVEVHLAGHDGLPADDRAWAIRSAADPTSVLLVSNGNRFLETALGLLANVELSVVPAAEYANALSAGDAQLIVFDGTPPADLPSSNVLFIAPPTATPWFAPSGWLEEPNVQVTDAGHPLLRYVDLSGLQVLRAVAIPLPKWGQAAVAARISASAPLGATGEQSWPLLFTGEVGGRRVAVLAFDLRDSDFVLRPGFPLLVSNLIEYLAPGAGGLIPTQVGPGEPVVVPAAPSTESVTFTMPDGQRITQVPEGGRVTFGANSLPGVYDVELLTSDGSVRRSQFAVNVFAPDESTIMPRGSLPIAEATGSQPSTATTGRRELWRPFALVALLILLVEWLYYYQTTTRRIVARIKSSATAATAQRPIRGG